ncbi:hypothetical protein [Aureliella helgolandensis]|nr:hypothetical protein [Aureliella helgolandensis]
MDLEPEILATDESALLRQAYVDAFVDTKCDHYAKYIRAERTFSDGKRYEGYIWDCLRQPKRVTFKRFTDTIVRFDQVFVFADDHSRDRVIGSPLWPYAALSVARFHPDTLLKCLPQLPEDIYVFDSSVSWTLILTHEHDRKRRICCSVGLDVT